MIFEKIKKPGIPPGGKKSTTVGHACALDIISLILRKNDATVVRDAVELVPPTALILYLENQKKAIFKIDDFLSNFSCKTIQNREKFIKQGLFLQMSKGFWACRTECRRCPVF